MSQSVRMSRRIKISAFTYALCEMIAIIDYILSRTRHSFPPWPLSQNTEIDGRIISERRDDSSNYLEQEVALKTKRTTGYGSKELQIRATFLRTGSKNTRWQLLRGELFVSGHEDIRLGFHVGPCDSHDTPSAYDVIFNDLYNPNTVVCGDELNEKVLQLIRAMDNEATVRATK